MTRTSRFLAALLVVTPVALAPAAAHANFYRYGPYRGFYGGPHYYGPRHFGPGGFVAGTVLGLGLGAAIGGVVPRYYAPPPVVYAPPPVVYAPPPPVVYAPAPYGYYGPRAYYAPGYGYYR